LFALEDVHRTVTPDTGTPRVESGVASTVREEPTSRENGVAGFNESRFTGAAVGSRQASNVRLTATAKRLTHMMFSRALSRHLRAVSYVGRHATL
jgi:hypothetical protein